MIARRVIVFLSIVLLTGLTTESSIVARSKWRAKRVAETRYYTPHVGVVSRPVLCVYDISDTDENKNGYGCVTYENTAARGETAVMVEIIDDSDLGLPTAGMVALRNLNDGNFEPIPGGVFCGRTKKPVEFGPTLRPLVVVVFTGFCEDGTLGFASQGTVKAKLLVPRGP